MSARVSSATVKPRWAKRAAKRATPQHAHRVFDERLRHMAQHARRQIALAADRVDEVAVRILAPLR